MVTNHGCNDGGVFQTATRERRIRLQSRVQTKPTAISIALVSIRQRRITKLPVNRTFQWSRLNCFVKLRRIFGSVTSYVVS
jgi:hypothetical protein